VLGAEVERIQRTLPAVRSAAGLVSDVGELLARLSGFLDAVKS
jgi:hypothetical protein